MNSKLRPLTLLIVICLLPAPWLRAQDDAMSESDMTKMLKEAQDMQKEAADIQKKIDRNVAGRSGRQARHVETSHVETRRSRRPHGRSYPSRMVGGRSPIDGHSSQP